MKTIINSQVIKFVLMGLLVACSTSCAAILAEAGIACPSGTSRSSYNTGDTGGDSVANRTLSRSSNQNNGDRDSKPFLSYRAGARAVWPIADQFSFSSGLFLAGKGSKFEDSNFNIEEKTTLTYIDIPARVHYEIGETGFNINSGLQPSILVGAKNTVTINGTETVTKGTENFNTLDVAAGVGVGYTFGNGMVVGLGYDFGLTNIIKENFGSLESKNRVLHLSVGIKVN